MIKQILTFTFFILLGLASCSLSKNIDISAPPIVSTVKWEQEDSSLQLYPIEKRGKWGAIDQKKWGYINHQGEWIISSQFDFAKNFSGGLAQVKTEKTGDISIKRKSGSGANLSICIC